MGPLADAPGGTLGVVGDAGAFLGWIVLFEATIVAAVVAVIRRPAAEWTHGYWSKLAWVAAVLYVAPVVAGFPIPLGAIAALCRARRGVRFNGGPAPLPRADVWRDWPWGAK